eukprot:scaffold22616_cov69-Skeletonema_menzelii.AAC.1
MVCGGSLPLGLSTGDDSNYDMEQLDFWTPRTRVELELKAPDCEAEYQDIDIESVIVDFDDGGV